MDQIPDTTDSNSYPIFASKTDSTEACETMDKFLRHLANEILKLKLNHNKTDAVYQLIGNLILHTKSFATRLIEDKNNLTEVEAVDTATSFVCERISEYRSSYKRKKKLSQNQYYVAPHETALGLRWDLVREHKTLSSSLRYLPCKAQHMSLIETLQSLFEQKDFHDVYFDYNSSLLENSNDCFSTFNSGKLFHENDLFKEHPNSIQIQLALDELEIANPIGSKATLYKLLIVYFSVANIPEKFRSKLSNINVLMICNSDDIKTEYTDINDVLRPIVRELKYLENVGIVVNSDIRLFGTLTRLTADNLGYNQSLGLAESFNSSYYCRICVCTHNDCQRLCVEEPSKIRNKEMYDRNIGKVLMSEKVNLTETQGIKRYCILNDLKYFHTCENFCVDIMHDLNEGVIPFFLSNLFKFLIKHKIITEHDLVNKFQYYDYGYLNHDHRPSTISLTKANLNQNASQSKCLFFHVPFVLFTELQLSNLKGIAECLQALFVITKISYSMNITDSDLLELQKNVELHLEYTLKYFQVDLHPKHHFLLHYARVIQLNGSLVPMSTKRYEGKHKTLKHFAKIGNNFINVSKTIATMHQQSMVACTDSYRDHYAHGLKTIISRDFIDFHKDILKKHLNLNEDLFEVKWFNYFDFKYKSCLFIFCEGILCEISRIIINESNFFLIVKEYEIKKFVKSLNSIEIHQKDPSIFKIIQFCDLNNKKVYEKKSLDAKHYIFIDTLETQCSFELIIPNDK